MAWVKVKSKAGSIIKMPQSVYDNMFRRNESYSLIEEPKPSPILEKQEKQEEVIQDGVQKPKLNANSNSGKGPKKTV